jgi:hypothetical protein
VYDGTENGECYIKLQKSPSETSEVLNTIYDESDMNQSNVFKWRKHFRKGREDVNDEERQGAPIMT